MDRYLSCTKVSRIPQLYLLSTACVYLASKFSEEIKEPCISDVSAVSMFGSSVKDIKRMEAKVLKELKWELTLATPQSILNELLNSITNLPSFSKSIHEKIQHDAQSFFTIALSDVAFLKYQPATLVFTVLSMVAPGLFEVLDLPRVFRFDPGMLAACAKMLMYKSSQLRQ
ncbi:UNVERIFIED_CONTAM: hypothetical protein HDU68_009200 [Siphonaria sp. JEL0065]|nr:hypothetical protein HDU68_009200 [Siphonaria sp. JEL0065]